jgi:hypothetical protein
MSILKDSEVPLLEVGNNALLVVDHGGVEHHFIYLLMEDEYAVVR